MISYMELIQGKSQMTLLKWNQLKKMSAVTYDTDLEVDDKKSDEELIDKLAKKKF